jgi:2-keto-4-pentenoate hydratase/2-oxohepta-3-ene-1,7-dioic acid hydratase in catechol pathway
MDVRQAAERLQVMTPVTMAEVIAGGKEALAALGKLAAQGVGILSEESIIYAPCVLNPEKIVCVGLNYASHREECKVEIPDTPVLFSKFNNALAAHRQLITLPGYAEKYDYEAELVIVIGKVARNVSAKEALSYVFGYTAGNDFSARDLQFRTSQWLLGKSCDHFAPIGPYLVVEEDFDPGCLDIQCSVNGEIRQSANTGEMIFSCAEIISYISGYMTLQPGDIIFTGTPGGVILGSGRERQWLKPGDEVSVFIDKIGHLVNQLR